MVFSTVAEGERLASAIPTGEKALRLVGAINLLASDYVAVYGVSRQTGAVSVYRSQYQLEGDEKSIDRDTDDRMQYDILREAFIKNMYTRMNRHICLSRQNFRWCRNGCLRHLVLNYIAE